MVFDRLPWLPHGVFGVDWESKDFGFQSLIAIVFSPLTENHHGD